MFADRYELGSLLGKGGMAEVFEAVAHGAHGFVRRVAIKRLLPEIGGDAHLVRMFLDEARIASHLHHAGIVAVLDYGVVDGCPFQVLELVEGWNASQLLRLGKARGTPMPIEVALLLATETAHALAYAHERSDIDGRPLGIVHRDVKPSNILVSKSGDIKLGDFGIAFARERSAVTTGFVARGTPGFMSPEQLRGMAVPATDIFAVGVSLHLLITGESPFGRDGPGLLAGREVDLSPTLPLDAREIIVRALRANASERYPSARELAQALGSVLAPRLETDAKTRLTQWLAEVETPVPRAPTATTSMLVRGGNGQFSQVGPTAPITKRTTTAHAPPPPTPVEPPFHHGTSNLPNPAPQLPHPEKHPTPARERSAPAAPTSSRSGAIFAIATLVPLALAGLALAAFFVIRARATPAVRSGDAKALAPVPVTSAEPPSSASPAPRDSAVTTLPPSEASPSAFASAAASSAKRGESIDVVVRSVQVAGSHHFDPDYTFSDSSAELKRLRASTEGIVRACLIGKLVRRGALVTVRLKLSAASTVTEVTAQGTCIGSYCRRAIPEGRYAYVPDEAADCVVPRLRQLKYPPLVSKHRDTGVELWLDYELH